MKKIIYFFILQFLVPFTILAQNNGIITGRVINESNNQPIPGINIRLVGTQSGAVSNKQGNFTISNLPPGIYSLQVTGIGYLNQPVDNISVTNAKAVTLEIKMKETVIQTQGVEVVADYFDKTIEKSVSTQSLNSQDVRRSPGAQEDVVRATQLLPGVGISSAGRNDLVVRGGAPFENLFVVDNFEVPNINHFGTQGSTGGPLSLINIDFVEDVQFSSGAFPSKYGDKTSSITQINLRNGNENEFGGQINLSATGFGANIEGPVSDKGSYWLSARRSYLDFLFKAAGFGFIPEYWDFQGKFNYNINSKNQLSFLTIVALDNVTLNNDTEEKLIDNSRVAVPNQKQYFSAITWKHFFENGYLYSTLGETLTRYDISQNDTTGNPVFNNISKEAETALKFDLYLQLSKTYGLNIGNQTKFASSLDYDILIPGYLRYDEMNNQFPLDLDTSFSNIRNSTYADLSGSIGRFQYNAGLRYDYYNNLGTKSYISPRASLGWQFNDISLISLSGGRFYQSPSYIWTIGDKKNSSLDAIRADQIVFSFQHTPRKDFRVQIEVYKKWYNNYPAREFRPYSVLSPSGFDDIVNDIPYGLEPLVSSGIGYSQGIELFIQKKFSDLPFYGLFSLTYSDTRFKSLKGDYIESAYNTPLILNLTGGYRIGNNWEVAAKFRYSTGLPTTPFDSTGKLIISEYNQGERLSDYHGLDLRVDKRWNFSNVSLITYIDVQNVYGRKNAAGVKWDFAEGKEIIQRSFGVLPSIGINFEF